MNNLDDIMKAVEKYIQKNNLDYEAMHYLRSYSDVSGYWVILLEITDSNLDRHWVVFSGIDNTTYCHYQFVSRSHKALDCFISEIKESM